MDILWAACESNLRFRTVIFVTLCGLMSVTLDEVAHGGDFMKGSPSGHSSVGETVLQEANDLVGDLAGPGVQPDEHLVRGVSYRGASRGADAESRLAICEVRCAAIHPVPVGIFCRYWASRCNRLLPAK